MKTLSVLVTCLCVILVGGCATLDTGRLDDMEARLARLEEKVMTGPQEATESGVEALAEEAASDEEEERLEPQVTVPETPTKRDIQISLKNAGYYDGEVDGKFGPKTKAAIEAFQDANNLVVDGKAGVNTWTKLRVFYTPPSEE